MDLISDVNLNNDHIHNCEINKPHLVISKCGEPGQAVLPDGTLGGTTVTVATITIDSSKFCRPCTKLEFTSNIIVTPITTETPFAGTLNFQVFKLCDNQQPIPIGGQFSFSLTQAAAAPFSTLFTFFVCDCSQCLNECCTYVVTVTAAGTIITGNIGVFAARLIAITTDNSE
ncbi:DUF4489 domain-containing protein [Clostridium sp. WILCCON 0269]|uniref:DUF4489 domain-containing protein n=1 Tax=Candidatus Clostridium eludens TaxID=3381663 RepID=A0ABW8SQR1_9CLOT